MEQVIVTGANGLIGSSFCSMLQNSYDLVTFDISNPDNPVDITNEKSVLSAVAATKASFIVHFAAFTDVTAAWQQTNDTSGSAYKVNVVGTQNLVKACNQTGKHLINISTSYVFDGEKEEQYTESDNPNPIEWYGKTKALAEEYIQNNANTWSIFRIDQPFKATAATKLDLPHKIAAELKTGTLFPQFDDHYFGPTWIPDFVKTLDWAIRTSATGLYHASSGETWSNYQFATAIAELLDKPNTVTASKLSDYLKANNRPYQKNTALNCEKLFSQIDFSFTSIKDALKQVQY